MSVRSKVYFPVPPVWSSDATASILEQLDSLVMRYIPQLEGVLLTHSNVRCLSTMGDIVGDSAFAVVPATFSGLVWRPEIGMKLQGTITLSSPSHVSLLLHDTFNAAISAQHLPSAKYEFVHYDDDAGAQRTDANERSVGFWRHKKSGARLGGETLTLSFTVISITVANHMISLHGSLLKDPFSVAPPRPGSLSFDQALATAEQHEDDAEVLDAPVQPRKVRWDDSDDEPPAPTEVEDDGEDSDADKDDYDATSDSDTDTDEDDTVAPTAEPTPAPEPTTKERTKRTKRAKSATDAPKKKHRSAK